MNLIFGLLCVIWFCNVQAQDKLRESAWKGNAEDAMKLVENYSIGLNGYPVNADSAIIFLQLSLDQKHPDALYLAGVGYLRGLNFPKNVTKGLQYLNESAHAGNTHALQVLFDTYANPDTSIFLEKKDLVKRDSAKAIQYAQKAAEKGFSWAMYELGYAYFQGSGVRKNDTLAVEWMEKAANKYLAKAQLTLGDWYFKGCTQLGPNLLKARELYKMAENNPYGDIEENTWGLVGVHNTYQVAKQFWNFYAFVIYTFYLEDYRMRWDGNSQKFMLDRERYMREMEAAQNKKIQEYEKKLKEKEKLAKQLQEQAEQIKKLRDESKSK